MRRRPNNLTRATPSSSSKFLPPDTDLIALQSRINSKTKSGHVNFYSLCRQDQPAEYAIIFQDGPRRATVRLRHQPSEADMDDIIGGLETWCGYKADSALYSNESPPLPMSEWA